MMLARVPMTCCACLWLQVTSTLEPCSQSTSSASPAAGQLLQLRGCHLRVSRYAVFAFRHPNVDVKISDTIMQVRESYRASLQCALGYQCLVFWLMAAPAAGQSHWPNCVGSAPIHNRPPPSWYLCVSIEQHRSHYYCTTNHAATQDCVTGVNMLTGRLEVQRSVVVLEGGGASDVRTGFYLNGESRSEPITAVCKDTHILVHTKAVATGWSVECRAAVSASLCSLFPAHHQTQGGIVYFMRNGRSFGGNLSLVRHWVFSAVYPRVTYIPAAVWSVAAGSSQQLHA